MLRAERVLKKLVFSFSFKCQQVSEGTYLKGQRAQSLGPSPHCLDLQWMLDSGTLRSAGFVKTNYLTQVGREPGH